MSYSLLIVDDEAMERSGLRHLVESEIPDFTEVSEAANGVELIRETEINRPDIVILDLDMPGLTGIEALQLVRSKGYQGRVVILTAHDKFQYARDAVHLDADAFILKPFKRKDMLALLKRLIVEIEEDHRAEREKQKLQSVIDVLLPVVRTDLIASIVSGDMDPRQDAAHQASLGPDFRGAMVLTVRLPDSFFVGAAAGNAESRADILNRLNEFLSESRCGLAGMIVSSKIPLVLFPPDPTDEFRCRLWAIQQAERIEAFLKSSLNIDVLMGIGAVADRRSQLPRSYRESIAALDQCEEPQRIHHYSDTADPAAAFDALAVAERLADGEAESAQSGWFIRALGATNEPEQLRDRALSVAFEFRRLQAPNATLVEVDNRTIFRELEKANGPVEIEAALKLLVGAIGEEARHAGRHKVHDGVKRARRYMEQNYMRNISLDIVAEAVGVSPYHLSHLFRETTDSTYIASLTAIRIAKAREFIAEGRYSLSEIAERCGYSNPTYFAKVFQKNTDARLEDFEGVCRLVQ